MASQLPGSQEYERRSPPVLQFSLITLLVLMTACALILSALFGAGRLVGASTSEILKRGLSDFVFVAPLWAVWLVGLSMALRRLRTHRKPAALAAIGLGSLMITSVLSRVLQSALICGIDSGFVTPANISWIFVAISLVYTVTNVVCWTLILVALFTGRPADPRPVKSRAQLSDPFTADTVNE